MPYMYKRGMKETLLTVHWSIYFRISKFARRERRDFKTYAILKHKLFSEIYEYNEIERIHIIHEQKAKFNPWNQIMNQL
jgi:hypothetical protein